MTAPNSKPRWYHLTPERFLLGLLLVQVFLLLSERFRWFAFNEKKGWTVLIALGVVCLALGVMLAGYVASLLVQRRFQFSFRALLVLVVVVSIPLGWFAWQLDQARRQKEAVLAITKTGAWVHYDYEYDVKDQWVFDAEPATPAWARKWLGDEFFYDAVEVGIDPTQVPDEAVKRFQRALPNCAIVDEVYP
jgi:MFS family permease